ncbi:tetratricopeptide repeat protein [Sphingorhabdus arenilitoris]|uniref:Tetratricopeptide repeat protein n=1 Tax=Sphingorhabdus arenilitoris TaxID=1490041 RepID=A0ABV8RFA0_9SPHN
MALTPKNPGPVGPVDDKRAASDEVFLREVEDAVRASDLESFWTRYGRWLLGLLLLGLASFGGWIYYQNHQKAEAGKVGEEFVTAMDDLKGDNEQKARTKLAELAKADQPGYRAMAQIVLANLDAEKEDKSKAIAAFAKIAADDSLPEPFRDLALIRQTLLEFDKMEPQKVVDRLKPLATPGNPWFGSAGEMTAIAYMKMGKENLAGPIFAQIAKQEDLPSSLRGRATEMAGSLGIDAVQLDEKKKAPSGETDETSKGGN